MDYIETRIDVDIDSNETHVTVRILNDDTIEGEEQFYIRLRDISTGSITINDTHGETMISILDDDDDDDLTRIPVAEGLSEDDCDDISNATFGGVVGALMAIIVTLVVVVIILLITVFKCWKRNTKVR